MNSLWSSEDIIFATKGKLVGPSDWSASGVSIDSRTTKEGDLFVALVGQNHDGHKFIGDAINKGASGILANKLIEDIPENKIILVKNTYESLFNLAKVARDRTSAKVVAVTGSVGKTGTKESLKDALAKDSLTHCNLGNQNNQIGVPLSLARMPKNTKYAVLEIGMSEAGEIAPLSRLVRPNVAIITNIAPAHLEFFESLDKIADAKAEIFQGLENSGIVIINQDNCFFNKLASKARSMGFEVLGFGESIKSNVHAKQVVYHHNCSCISADICGQSMTIKVGAPGKHIVQNSLAVLAAVYALKGDLALAGVALSELSLPKGRGNLTKIKLKEGELKLIDESYNASPASMSAAINVLGCVNTNSKGRRIAVLGDMLELGAESPDFHKKISKDLTNSNIDVVFCAGKNMRHLIASLPDEIIGFWESSTKSLINKIINFVKPNDVIMVKGSRGSEMNIVVEKLMEIHKFFSSNQMEKV